MAFPTTPILDDFNRADGALGANWTNPIEAGNPAPTVFSNAAVGTGSVFNDAYWNPSTFLNVEVYCSIPAAATSWAVGLLYARTNNEGPSTNDYKLVFHSTDGLNIYRQIGGVDTGPLASDAATLAVAGMKVGMRVTNVGADIFLEIWADTGSGWTLRASATDTGAIASFPAVAAAGHIGFDLYGDGASLTRSIDNFGGGTVSNSATVAWITA